MDSFTIAGPTSGPDLNYTYSYTSILRPGLAAGDTPDAPHKHLGTRGPSTTASALPTPSEARAIKRRTWSSELGTLYRSLVPGSRVSRPLSLWRRAYNLRRQSKLEASLEDPTRRVKALPRKAENVGRITRLDRIGKRIDSSA
ncbi:heat shock 70 kDa protein 17 [Dorcoceras hygrometricum]|uniref:Heat shock 70 kDa protein 17 n=1 Tax=Dorcoceras hygrometricum TaxID=472368 RepID=A0A2Z7AT92_9LAMI|nr:heat shock 70 kDa protein 17 [Dorcoceras hygrometricum]